MIDVAKEELKTLIQAAKGIPRRRMGRPTAISTLFRWTTKGLRGHILESVMIGGVRFTSTEALTRFFTNVTNAKSKVRAIPITADNTAIDAGLRAHGLLEQRTVGGDSPP